MARQILISQSQARLVFVVFRLNVKSKQENTFLNALFELIDEPQQFY